MVAITSHPESAPELSRFSCDDDPKNRPTESGVYLTPDYQSQAWVRYFDASDGRWYVSSDELEADTAR
jgi:hypothetical protein